MTIPELKDRIAAAKPIDHLLQRNDSAIGERYHQDGWVVLSHAEAQSLAEQLEASVLAERDRCLRLIAHHIGFSHDQQHLHSWHDLQDCLEKIRGDSPSPSTAFLEHELSRLRAENAMLLKNKESQADV